MVRIAALLELIPLSKLRRNRLKASGANLRNGVSQLGKYTLSELAQHTSKEDVWIAYQGKIYAISQYLSFHPGGMQKLMEVAGTDVTAVFMKVHPWVNLECILGDECLIGFLIPAGNSKQLSGCLAEVSWNLNNTRGNRDKSPVLKKEVPGLNASNIPLSSRIPRSGIAHEPQETVATSLPPESPPPSVFKMIFPTSKQSVQHFPSDVMLMRRNA
ncbi:hypothetical protein CcCBS67573_g00790 [Chytriomyces confervae]|uniref:Cytochrome b5 heme-binding domain-containing protein n=1 Tax=Chytriomyces confervae TaxID=246404 RepID=A0A507FRJ2_9FUNG|nr:hypothetical protein CcCBS67573_g00790 [Chytriomyces confervae]